MGDAAAESDDFFRSRPFFDAEGVSHTLVVGGDGDDDRAAASGPRDRRFGAAGRDHPLRVSRGHDPERPRLAGRTPRPSTGPRPGWSASSCATGSAPSPAFGGATKRSAVQVHDPGRERRLRVTVRRADPRKTTAGLPRRGPARPGHVGRAAGRASTHVYTETMERTPTPLSATSSSRTTSATILGSTAPGWSCARSPDGDRGGGAIVVLSDGLLHYYLGGTAEAHRSRRRSRTSSTSMIGLADELGVPLNLGGGVKPGDGLEDFKRGFANAELPFHTHEIVCDPDAYRRSARAARTRASSRLYRAAAGLAARGAGRAPPRASPLRIDVVEEAGELVVQALRRQAPLEDRVGVDQAGVGHAPRPACRRRRTGEAGRLDGRSTSAGCVDLTALLGRRRRARRTGSPRGPPARRRGRWRSQSRKMSTQVVRARDLARQGGDALSSGLAEAQPKQDRSEDQRGAEQRVLEHRHLDEQRAGPLRVVDGELERRRWRPARCRRRPARSSSRWSSSASDLIGEGGHRVDRACPSGLSDSPWPSRSTVTTR